MSDSSQANPASSTVGAQASEGLAMVVAGPNFHDSVGANVFVSGEGNGIVIGAFALFESFCRGVECKDI